MIDIDLKDKKDVNELLDFINDSKINIEKLCKKRKETLRSNKKKLDGKINKAYKRILKNPSPVEEKILAVTQEHKIKINTYSKGVWIAINGKGKYAWIKTMNEHFVLFNEEKIIRKNFDIQDLRFIMLNSDTIYEDLK
jgi:hypothetical protein